MAYRYIPNGFATAMFNLTAPGYTDEGLTGAIEQALGKDNYDRYMMAQDPLCGGKTEGTVDIVLNRDQAAHDPNRLHFECIGVVRKVDSALKIRLK